MTRCWCDDCKKMTYSYWNIEEKKFYLKCCNKKLTEEQFEKIIVRVENIYHLPDGRKIILNKDYKPINKWLTE